MLAANDRDVTSSIPSTMIPTSSSYSLSSCWLELFYLLQQKELGLDSIISSLYGIENKLNYYLDGECMSSDWSELST